MPLPAGFKVNGSKTDGKGVLVPPRVQKMMAFLSTLPANELMTSMEFASQAGYSTSGSFVTHPALKEYREKVDGKLFWGSRKSIAQLRKQLALPEGSNENQ
jgi:hypothetical protein